MMKFISKASAAVFGVAMSLVFILLLFFQNAQYACKRQLLLSNITIILILTLMFFLLYVAKSFCLKNKSVAISGFKLKLDYDKVILICTVILFLVQCYVFTNIFFLSGWDTKVVREASENLAYGRQQEFLLTQSTYFSRYPNNVVLIYLGAIVLKINRAVGMLPVENAMLSLLAITCALNSATCFLIYKTVALFTSKSRAAAGWCLAVLAVGISPWTVIYYSDSIGLIVPILCFYLYAVPVQRKYLRYVIRSLSVFVAVAGYYVKPQCIIILIAIFGMEAAKVLSQFTLKKLIRFVSLMLVCIVSYLLVNGVIDAGNRRIGFETDPNRTFGTAHFFMMGLNEEAGGVFSGEDRDFSDSCETAQERRDANLEIAFDRLRSMGVFGTARHVAKKMLTAFNDGTYCWSGEGHFYLKVPENINGKAAPFLKSIFYNTGTRYKHFTLLAQFVWLMVLALSAFSSFLHYDDERQYHIHIMQIALLGLIMFECLFEVRARYLYIYVPIFCVLATISQPTTLLDNMLLGRKREK